MTVLTSFEAYQASLNSIFRVVRDGAPDLELTLTDAAKSVDTDAHTTFSLIFRGPTELLPQGSYRLQHDVLKEIEMFLVPLGQVKGGGYRYQAVFNLIRDMED